MGRYLNLGNASFQSMRKGLYVDKSKLIDHINDTLGTKDKLTCVTRPRWFGKSYAAQMLCAYYDKSCDSRLLFENLAITKSKTFSRYLNKYPVIYLVIVWFISTVKEIREIVRYLQKEVIRELREIYPSATIEEENLPVALRDISSTIGEKFIIIIDEWDVLFREVKQDKKIQKEYLRLLQALFESNSTDKMIEAAYITGILPIKKYGTPSALPDFHEYTMIEPQFLAEYVGFTNKEVQELCREYGLEYAEVKKRYDGYPFSKTFSIYNSNSIIQAIRNKEFGDYWIETETYEVLKYYINMDKEGLKGAILSLLNGNRCKISTKTFQNDMLEMKSKDDVLTLLIHLGYLAYDGEREEVFIPNQEVTDEFKNAVEISGW
ncbi:MAG: AAA family ATPase [Lachnospiraceae bacterium]|nr:AAA family ATPase [Lachnospiraceae bacterium]